MEGETTEREAVEGEPVEDVDKEDFVPAGPQPIKRLSTDVINQIAAAEIIHRPSNAIKELIENSLDAGSTSIKITIKDGGLKLIQIADNGHGINKTDLALLCTRYATSKLRQFEDLQSLVTYGFRGEALASISYCSHVEVITKIRSEGCGWKANYSDGVMIPPKPGVTADPKPAAANDGTVISAEDLFYNMPLRKRAFKSPSDEYNRILDVIQKYAVHNPHVSWVCKKAGTSLPDISTPADSTSKAVIALLYTPSLAADLLEVPLTTLRPEDKLGAKVRGWVSSANTNWARRGGWLLFINNRLVDSSKMKKAVDSLYTAYLAKGASPWIYLSLEIQPEKVDVNVHPTKSDVHFLNEDEMIEAVVGVIQSTLANANISRSFSVQTLLPGASEPSQKGAKKVDSTPAADSATASQRKPAPNYKVRIDPSSRTLNSMIRPTDSTQLSTFTQQVPVLQSDDEHPRKKRGVNGTGDDVDGAIEVSDEDQDESSNGQSDDGRERVMQWDETPGKGRTSAAEIEESACEFTSIRELRREMRKKGCAELNEIMTRHSFVGIADTNLCLSLIQFSTKLFLVNHASLGDEHFYQIGLRQFGAFHRIKLEPAPSLSDLLEIAIEDEGDKIRSNGLDTTKVHAGVLDLLMDKREMVDEYFSLRITEDGLVETLPLVLKGYMPNLDRLPHFLLCLATEVDWTDEKACFDSILRELAFFYSPRPTSDHVEDALTQGDGIEGEEAANQRWQLEHVLFPSFRKHTQWPKELIGPHVQQVANLPDLFRIFERC